MTDLDHLLHSVTKPARYTGGEWNAIVKDWEATPIRIALSYPDTYEIGMSNIAIPILYDILNRQPDVLAERVYAPWVDMAAAMRSNGIPLYALESKHPLKDFDIIGFSLGYELTYTNVLNLLDLAQLPVLASERSDAHPLIIAGGSGTLNPEPMSDFINVFVVGDGEEVILEFIEVFRDWKKSGKKSKKDLLRQLATIPGVYVPSFYEAEYHPEGTLKSFSPTIPEAQPSIRRRLITKLPTPVTRPVVPYIEVIHDRGAIEIQRGCSRGCRFCQAGFIYRPIRERPKEEVLKAAGELISNCGYDEVSLVSLNTSDYGEIGELVDSLVKQYPNLAISLPSLRISQFSIRLMGTLPTKSKTGLTFAPEAGSERLRRAINKVIPEEELLETAATAFERGWTNMKLYFMLGLPMETMEDIDGIIDLVNKVRLAGRNPSRRPQIRVSASTFVPKPHTPFQWAAQAKADSLAEKHLRLRQGLLRKGIKLSWSDTKQSLLEATLSRGDRRLGKVIYNAWKSGAVFDAWSECFNFDNWMKAFADAGLDPSFYAQRERQTDELLPWSFIDTGVPVNFLKLEYERATTGNPTPDCRLNACNTCGLQRWHTTCQDKFAQLSEARKS